MKFIITEEQKQKIAVLRRFNADWEWIIEIVKEGMDLDDPCDFRNEEIYLKRVCSDSANTYLFNYLDDWQNETFQTLSLFIQDLIRKRMGDDIIEYYIDIKEDGCDPN